MNRVYRIIWSAVRREYVVVSELTRRKGKEAASCGGSRKHAAVLAALALLGALSWMPGEALAAQEGTAAEVTGEARLYGIVEKDANGNTTDENSIDVQFVYGTGNEVTSSEDGDTVFPSDHVTILGDTNQVKGSTHSMIFGNGTTVIDRPTTTSNTPPGGWKEEYARSGYVISTGNNNTLEWTRNSVVYGHNVKTYNFYNGVAIGNDIQIYGYADNHYGIPNESDTNWWKGNTVVGSRVQIGSGGNGGLVYRGNTISGDDNQIMGDFNAAIGQGSRISGNQNAVVGHNVQMGSVTRNDEETIIGNNRSDRNAVVGDSVEIRKGDTTHGLGSQDGYNSILGFKISAQGARNIVSGSGAIAIGNDTIVSGYRAKTYYGQSTILIGESAKIGTENNSLSASTKQAIGIGASVSIGDLANYSTAMGAKSSIGENTQWSTAIGSSSSVAKDLQQSVAIGGYGAKVTSSYATALGTYASVSGELGTALGYHTDVSVKKGTALGDYSTATDSDILKGYTPKFDWDAKDDSWGVISVGSSQGDKAFTRRITNVANGRISATSTDAVNGSQLYHVWKDLYNQIVNPNQNPFPGDNETTLSKDTSGTGGSSGESNFDKDSNTLSNPVNPDRTENKTEQDVHSKSDFQLVNGNATLDTPVKTEEGKTITTGYKADENGNVSLVVQDKAGAAGDPATQRHVVVVSDVASKAQQDINTVNIEKNTIAINNLSGRVDNLDSRISKVGAGAAALAALHPLDFDPDEKLDFAAGFGHYGGESAVAIGAFYRPNEDTMFSIGGNFGNGENMINAGISFKIGQKNHVSVSRVAMAKEIIELRKEIEELRSFLADGLSGNGLDLSKIQLFPDTPENHWAYDYVSTLAGNGILEGYPDGYFKGDRVLTRYEMAAVLYRAMLNGAKLSAKALTEFAPELDRIRVDTITRDEQGMPDIQRVRVVPGRE